jgi:uncharacterized protein (DUF488 family)
MKHIDLFTIGYEGSTIDNFVATLRAAQVDLLVDVRDVPISRKRGFSKNSLAERLKSEGLSYLHLRGLGDPKEGRIAAREGRHADFRRVFSCHLVSESAQVHLERAVVSAKAQTVCLMCFERDHRFCHRLMIADAMCARGPFKSVHLGVETGLAAAERTSFSRVHDGAKLAIG